MSSALEDSTINDKMGAAVGPVGLGKCEFTCGPGMQKQWVESVSVFLNFVGSRYGQSVKASLEAGELIVTEVDESILRKFDTETEK